MVTLTRSAAERELPNRIDTEEYADVLIKPLKKNIQVQELALAWAPFWQVQAGASQQLIAAYR